MSAIYKTFPVMYLNSNVEDVREDGYSSFLVRNVLFSINDYMGIHIITDEKKELIRILLESEKLAGKEYQTASQKKGMSALNERVEKYLRSHYGLCEHYAQYFFIKTVLVMDKYFSLFEGCDEKECEKWVNTLINIYINTYISVLYNMIQNDFEKKDKKRVEFNIPQIIMSGMAGNKKEDLELFHVFNYFFSQDKESISFENFKTEKDKIVVDWSDLFSWSNLRKEDFIQIKQKSMGVFNILESELAESTIPEEILIGLNLLINHYMTNYYRSIISEISYSLMQFFNESEKVKMSTYQNGLNEDIKRIKTLNRTLTRQLKEYENQESIKSVMVTEVKTDELEQLQRELEEKSNALLEQDEQNQKNVRKLQWQENRISELEYMLKYYSSIESDLLTLQNENNSLKAQIDLLSDIEESEDEDKYEEKLNAIKDVPLFFLGGISDMMERFVKIFPNSEYVNISDDNSNFIVPPKYQYAVVYTRVLKHSHSRRLESFLPKEQIIYVNVLNTRLVVSKIYDRINGHV